MVGAIHTFWLSRFGCHGPLGNARFGWRTSLGYQRAALACLHAPSATASHPALLWVLLRRVRSLGRRDIHPLLLLDVGLVVVALLLLLPALPLILVLLLLLLLLLVAASRAAARTSSGRAHSSNPGI